MPGKRGRPPSDVKKVKVHVYLPEILYEQVKKEADSNRRSISAQIQVTLESAAEPGKNGGKR